MADKIIGSPITPAMLQKVGALTRLPAPSGDFDPDGNWTNSYRIWLCHGYQEKSNDFKGHLVIKRGTTLSIKQKVLNDSARINDIAAEITDTGKRLVSPFRWRLESFFSTIDGKEIPKLHLSESGRVVDAELEVTTAGKTFRRPGSKRLISDWALFDFVQRLDFKKGPPIEFDVLEDLSVVRPDQQLFYRGTTEFKNDLGKTVLHCFYQVGKGLLPYEYWLDERHRLRLVITQSRAYILDTDAERKTEESIVKSKAYYAKRAKREKGTN